MKRLTVTLADAPRDVLIYLVDHGPATFAAIAESVPPSGADNPRQSVALALGLLRDMGCVSPLPGQMWCATLDGCKTVALAREQATA